MKSKVLLVVLLFEFQHKDLRNYLFIDVSASIPIVSWKLTKNCSQIINDKSIPGCSPNSGNNQRFKLVIDLPSIPEKDIELFYYLIGRLLFTSKITRLDVQVCVTYILTRMKLQTNYHKDRHLNIDIFCEEDKNVFIVTNRRLIYVFPNVFLTQQLHTKHTPTAHLVIKTQEYIHRFGRSFQEYK